MLKKKVRYVPSFISSNPTGPDNGNSPDNKWKRNLSKPGRSLFVDEMFAIVCSC